MCRDLNGNWLKGPIPSIIGELVGLKSLYLYNNFLSGTIPPQLGSLNTTEQIWLHNNDLTGSIPSELGNLKSCKELSIYGNMLSGSVPKSLSVIPSLRYALESKFSCQKWITVSHSFCLLVWQVNTRKQLLQHCPWCDM